MDKNSELEYLMNPVLYDKYKQLSCKEDELIFKRNRQFYKKRIGQMAKDALREKQDVPPQILKYYNEFARRCIEHFKCEDETECYQNELGLDNNDSNSVFTDINTNSNTIELSDGFVNPDLGKGIVNIDTQLLGQQPKKKMVTMDNFVRKTTSKPPVPPIIPKQKEINTNDIKYRTKGVKIPNKKLKKKEI
jgi:hypothetical protein